MGDNLQASLQATLDRIKHIIEIKKRFRLQVGYVPEGTEPEPETFRFAITTVRGERVAVITTYLSIIQAEQFTMGAIWLRFLTILFTIFSRKPQAVK